MKKVMIFGCGRLGKAYIDECFSKGITEFELVDSDCSLWETEYKGKKIYDPARIIWQNYDLVVIASDGENAQEIFSKLVMVYKIPKEKIAPHQETVVLSTRDVYNLGNMSFNSTVELGGIFTGKELRTYLKEDSLNDLEKFYFYGKHKSIYKRMHYFDAYERAFSRYRGKDISILEIGVYKGGSLQMWKEYFKTENNRVKVYGIDIDPACKFLEENDIKIYIGSQEDREFLRKIKKEIGKVDIVIDDGGHTMNQQIVSFEELFDFVDENGIYLCEDVHTSYLENYGGVYKGRSTFMEYSKNLIDMIHTQYFESEQLEKNRYSDTIKSITYYDSMVFVEKKKRTTKSISVCV